MNRQLLTHAVLGAAIISLGIFGGVGSAHAGGFLADTFVRSWSPGLADGLDGVSAGIRDRSSSASVYNHVMGGLGQYDNPIGRPAQPAAPMPPASAPPLATGPLPMVLPAPGGLVLGNFCATPAGVFGPGPLNPVGADCNAQTPYGMFFGQVTRL